MKRLTLLLVVIMGLAIISYSQEQYRMFRTIYLTPDYENLKDLGKAMSDYTKTYRSEVPSRTGVWVVYTGPHTGDWLLTTGPLTFTDMDNMEYSDDQRDHWLFKVLPNVEELSEGEFWRLDDDASHMKEDYFTGREVLTFFGLKDFEEYRFEEMLKQVKTVYEEKGYERYYYVYYPRFDGCDKRDVVIVSLFDKWAEFDEDKKFMADFEDVHGEGSWSRFMKEYQDVVESTYDELILFIPELSGDRDN